jgi:hypothetical protein
MPLWRPPAKSAITRRREGTIMLRSLAGCGVALVCLAGVICNRWPSLAFGCATLGFAIGCYLHPRRHQETDDVFQLCRIATSAGGAVMLVFTLGAVDGNLVLPFAMLAALVGYAPWSIGLIPFLFLYSLACLIVFVAILMSQPDRTKDMGG